MGLIAKKCFPNATRVMIDSMCKISIRGFTRNQISLAKPLIRKMKHRKTKKKQKKV
jgi:hypothetical protein